MQSLVGELLLLLLYPMAGKIRCQQDNHVESFQYIAVLIK